MPSVILMLRTYAFTGKRRVVLVALSIIYWSIIVVLLWDMIEMLNRLSQTLHC